MSSGIKSLHIEWNTITWRKVSKPNKCYKSLAANEFQKLYFGILVWPLLSILVVFWKIIVRRYILNFIKYFFSISTWIEKNRKK